MEKKENIVEKGQIFSLINVEVMPDSGGEERVFAEIRHLCSDGNPSIHKFALGSFVSRYLNFHCENCSKGILISKSQTEVVLIDPNIES